MSLLTICQDALKEISGIEVPSSFYGNSNQTATLAVALANRAGRSLEKEHRWQELVTEYTFSTSSGTATYALPTSASTGGAFRAFANMSQWDRTNQWRMRGPIPPSIYQWLKSGITVASDGQRWFAIRGDNFTIYPTPSSTSTIAFDYYSQGWILKQSDSTKVTRWTSDNDTARIDEDLIALDLKWRFLEAKGWAWEAAYKEREAMVEALQADNGGKAVLDMNGGSLGMGGYPGNLPETGFGS